MIRLTAIFPSLMIFLLAGISTPAAAANLTDLLNRTSAWTHSELKTLTLKAHPDAHVWFNGVEIQNFDGEHPVELGTPGTTGQWIPWQTLAILEGAGEGAGNPPQNPHASPDAKAAQSGAVWIPPANEAIHYDNSGNRLDNAQWDYGWDAKNQLTRARTKNHTTAPQAYDITFTYDSEGRRVKKHVIELANGLIKTEKIITYLWDDWDLLYERHQLPSGLTTLERRYLWGPDLADGAAGGAGGLLLISETRGSQTQHLIPLYDGTGHVIALTNLNKDLLATYAYGPFGERIHATGPLAQSNPWRYATKYLDEETGLYYFGHRYFDPVTGQWLSREPLGESESINLYAYCGNDPINKIDVLSLASYSIDGIIHTPADVDISIPDFLFSHFAEQMDSQTLAAISRLLESVLDPEGFYDRRTSTIRLEPNTFVLDSRYNAISDCLTESVIIPTLEYFRFRDEGISLRRNSKTKLLVQYMGSSRMEINIAAESGYYDSEESEFLKQMAYAMADSEHDWSIISGAGTGVGIMVDLAIPLPPMFTAAKLGGHGLNGTRRGVSAYHASWGIGATDEVIDAANRLGNRYYVRGHNVTSSTIDGMGVVMRHDLEHLTVIGHRSTLDMVNLSEFSKNLAAWNPSIITLCVCRGADSPAASFLARDLGIPVVGNRFDIFYDYTTMGNGLRGIEHFAAEPSGWILFKP